jgi:CubicO group peptidase (beta-lactamase class C family)
MTGLLSLTLSASLLAPAAAAPPAAPALADLGPEVGRRVRPLVEGRKGVAGVVGVVRRDGRRVLGFGDGPAGAGRPPDGDTLFEIGSVTKVFTAVALADLAREGLLRLDDPLRRHLPPDLTVPRLPGSDKEVTLRQLATHTSGLQVEPDFLPHLLFRRPKDWANPYSHYDRATLARFLARARLAREPGLRYSYSNLGVGLLGIALAHRAKAASYEELVVRRVCAPLGLADTRIKLSPGQGKRFARGHDEQGRPTSTWDFATLEACGGLRSSANDLLRFLSANLGLAPAPLRPVLEGCHEPLRDTTNRGVRVALGWHVVSLPGGGQLVAHSGATGGFRCFVGFRKEREAGVVVLANSHQDDWRIDQIGAALLLRVSARP